MEKSHRDQNTFIKYTLLVGVFLLSAFIGSIWIGWNLTIIILGIGAVISVLSINVAPSKLLKWRGARKLDRYYNADLYELVNRLAKNAGLSYSPDIYYINSNVPNAFALGTKEEPVVGITRGLVSLLNQRELKGVIAHEISHIKNNDLFIKGLALGFGNLTNTLSTIGKILLILMFPLYLFGVETISLFAVAILIFSPILNILLQLGISRSMEFLADYDASVITGDPMGLASALNRIDSLNRPWWSVFSPIRSNSSDWLRSHPKTSDRIEKLRAMVPQQVYQDSGMIGDIRFPSFVYRRSPHYWF